MKAPVKILPRPDFDKYLEEASKAQQNLPPDKIGERLFVRRCSTCHTADGTADSAHIGPTLKGIFGHDVQLKSGESVLVDENYLRESILEPSAKIVAGYSDQMQTFKGDLKDEDILALIAFIKSLK
jgi:cytochrome c oxidase subunit 2